MVFFYRALDMRRVLQIIRISMLRSPTFMMGGELLVQKAKTEESRPGEGRLEVRRSPKPSGRCGAWTETPPGGNWLKFPLELLM
jgi:hypothetical protein